MVTLPEGYGPVIEREPLKTLTRNAAHCSRCNDIIESKHRHDFVWCSCKALAVDGGLAYAKRCYDPKIEYTNMNEYAEGGGDPK